jgi:DeoR/GlpR family transcriptional regulator of sugar metabolism
MSDKNRLDKIRNYIELNQRVDVEEISRVFEVSQATARRNLDQLAEAGIVQRTHGGATALRKAPPELPVTIRGNSQSDEKECIARAAIELVNEGDTLLMGGGTTVFEVAKKLVGKKNITVITNSLMVSSVLSTQPDISLFVLGGFVRQAEQLTYGLYTEQILLDLYVDKVIMGVRSISLRRGVAIDFLPELSTERMFLKKGKEIIVVADHTKFLQEATTTIGPLTAIHHIVTDFQTSEKIVGELRGLGIDVIVAADPDQGLGNGISSR